VGALLVVGVGALALREAGGPAADWLTRYVTLDDLPEDVRGELELMTLIPTGALLVVFVRLTLGFRTLGPFRPLLIAVGLEATGILVGLALFLTVCGLIALVRPRLEGRGVPYFGRLSILLVLVALAGVALALAGVRLGLEPLTRSAHFPTVVLCLAADGFARVLARDGFAPAGWRLLTTVATSLAILAVDAATNLHTWILLKPEILLLELAGIVLLSTVLDLRLLERLNPRQTGDYEVEARPPDGVAGA
jgi:hypothetical protein